MSTSVKRNRLIWLLVRVGSVFLPLMGSEQTTLLLLGSLVGILLAFGALAFGALVDVTSRIFFYSPDEGLLDSEPREHLLHALAEQPLWWLVLAPAVGGLLVGPLIHRFAREAKGHGIPEVMQAVALRGGRIRKRVAAVKVAASALTIGSGGSAGREGPVVQIGASIASGLATLLGFKAERTKTLVACGAAAGIAATFNAPIAGVVFSLEIITGSFGLASFTPVVASAVMATVMTHYLRGNAVVFEIPAELKEVTSLSTPLEVVPYAVLGLVAGLVSVLYIRTLYWTEDRFEGLKRCPEPWRPVVGGLAVGCLGLLFPRILGQGYETIVTALRSRELAPFEHIDALNLGLPPLVAAVGALLLLTVAKIAATSLTIGSGGSGGVFAPALFIGATLGAAFGLVVHALLPETTSSPAGYALAGMGALVAGVTHAPISAVLVLFEMTDDYDVILPLMFASVISTAVCSQWCGDSIYTLKLRRKGVKVHEGRDQTVLAQIRVSEIMRPAEITIPEGTPFRQVVRMVTGSYQQTYPVTDSQGALRGVLVFDDLRESLLVQELGDLVIARELASEIPVRLHPDHDLRYAFECFSASGLLELPVVDREQHDRLVGVLARSAAMDAYHRALSDKPE